MGGKTFGTAPDLRGFPCTFVSSKLSTRMTHDFTPPLKLEFRAKLPVGPGLGALVSLKPKHTKDFKEWPYTGEIHILEGFGNTEGEGQVRFGVVTGPFPLAPHEMDQKKSYPLPTSMSDQDCCWRTYEFEWSLGKMVFKVDGVTGLQFDNYFPSLTFDKNSGAEFPEPFTGEWYLDIELAVGGEVYEVAGIPPLWGDNFNALARRRLQIEYMRAYTCA